MQVNRLLQGAIIGVGDHKGGVPTRFHRNSEITGNPGSVRVPQYSSSKITVFVWGKNRILKFLGSTK